jgi:Astacin (Peptidase family M12A)
MQLAIKENKSNAPPPPPPQRRRFGASSMAAPAKMALEAGKKWANGKTLGVYFMDGSATQKARVKAQALKWEAFANIKFNFAASKSKAHIRISFKADDGSWSYIGTDNLGIPKREPTMNFGWLTDTTDEREYERVVVHEFGHALGAIHEHQNPKGGIQWNLPAVYKYFGGPPNNWSKEDIETNVVGKYSVDQLNASKYDPDSIMLYRFDGALIKGGKPTKFNTRLSTGDKRFIKAQYPKA